MGSAIWSGCTRHLARSTYGRLMDVLQTPRMRLRPFTMADLDDVEALDADPAVMRFVTGGEATPRRVLRDEHLPYWIGFAARGEHWGFWAAVDRDTDRFLGWFHLRPDAGDPPDRPELGYRLHRAVWGRGLATEGSRVLVDLALGHLGAASVYATTMSVNTASRRVMEKVGMRLVREFKADWPVQIPGDEHGDVEYELTRERWQEALAGRG